MGLKLLHSADWHLGAPLTSFPEEQRHFLRRAQRDLPGKIAGLCRREQCDLVLLAGDIFDGLPSREFIEVLRQALADCAVPVFISPGNHDCCQPGSPWLEEAWPENVTIFTGHVEEILLPELGCRIYGAGYQSMDCAPLLEGFRAKSTEEYQIGLFHGDPVTKDSPYCPVTAGQVRSSGLDYLALGHIHKAGSFSSGATLCGWPGCPMGRGWDETGEKGVYLVTLGKETDLEFVSLDTPRFFDLEVDGSDGIQAALDSLLPPAPSQDFYRITLTGSGAADPSALKPYLQRFPHLHFRDRTIPEEDLWSDVGSDTFRGIYFRLLQEQDSPQARLAARISKQILAGREVSLP